MESNNIIPWIVAAHLIGWLVTTIIVALRNRLEGMEAFTFDEAVKYVSASFFWEIVWFFFIIIWLSDPKTKQEDK